MHIWDVEAPDECNWCLEIALVDAVFSFAIPRLNAYREWLLQERHQYAYEFYRTALQIHLTHNPDKRLVNYLCLKSPIHLFFLNDLLEVFPDARLVWLHRDPASVLPSMAKLYEGFWAWHPYEPGIGDKMWLGQHVLKFTAEEVKRGMAFRDEFAKATGRGDQFYDVSFRELQKFVNIVAWRNPV